MPYQPCDHCGTPVKVHAKSPSLCACSDRCEHYLHGVGDLFDEDHPDEVPFGEPTGEDPAPLDAIFHR